MLCILMYILPELWATENFSELYEFLGFFFSFLLFLSYSEQIVSRNLGWP